jgi:hypothetical protein
MRYIHLTNDSYILHLSTGLTTVTLKSFNFHKIKKLINKGAEEAEILPLLETPPLPDGIYEAYPVDSEHFYYLHTSKTGTQQLKRLGNDEVIIALAEEKKTELKPFFAGVYASLEDLEEDWPEYLF